MDSNELAAEFEAVSREFPRLSLVYVPRADVDFSEWFNGDEYDERFGGRYAVQYWFRHHANDEEEDKKKQVQINGKTFEVETISIPTVFKMPVWNWYNWRGSVWDKPGIVAMWLHRDFGRDPLAPRDEPGVDAAEQLRAIESLYEAFINGGDWISTVTDPPWIKSASPGGARRFEYVPRLMHGVCRSWLFFLIAFGRFRLELHKNVKFGVCDDVPKELARLIRARGVDNPKPDDPVNEHVNPFPNDGLDTTNKLFTWGGREFGGLTPSMMLALSCLWEAHRNNRPASLAELENKCGTTWADGFYKVFEQRRNGKKQTHPVRKIVVGRSHYNLIDPSEVISIPD